jgi:hypothetical protein
MNYLKCDNKYQSVLKLVLQKHFGPIRSKRNYKRIAHNTDHVQKSNYIEPSAYVLGFVSDWSPEKPQESHGVHSQIDYDYKKNYQRTQ